MIKLKKIEQTCSMCPSQWDAWDEDGEYYYIRFRWGFLSVDKGSVMGEPIFGKQISDSLDGYLTTDDMLGITGMELVNA